MQDNQFSDSRRLFEYIVKTGLEPETMYSLDQLSDAIGKSIRQNRTPVYTAIRLLEKHHKRTLVCVPGAGYRIARANESKDIVEDRVTRATKQVRRGIHTATHTEKSALTQQERLQLDQTRAGLLALERQMTQVRRKIKKVETHGDEIETAHDDRLNRLEREIALLRQEQRLAA